MVALLSFPPLDPQSPGTGTLMEASEPQPRDAAVASGAPSDARIFTSSTVPISLETPTCAPTLECGYRNTSDRMVILRCLGPDAFFLERVVFPFELLSFTCPPESEVEILTHSLGGPELLESMPAGALKIDNIAEAIPAPALTDAMTINPWLQAS